jgi:hypothetical protein
VLRAPVDVDFEPSAAAQSGDHLLVLGDKQPYLWRWTPGAREVTRMPDVGPHPLSPASCCASVDDGHWADTVKPVKAKETCQAHGLALDAPLPWLKGEGLAVDGAGRVFLGGNMGFGCAENDVSVVAVGAAASRVPGLGRGDVLRALGARDVRVEGLAMTPDGGIAVLAVRQIDDAMARVLLVGTRAADGYQLGAPVALAFEPATLAVESLGLSDVSIAPDGRLLLTASLERHHQHGTELGGVALVTEEAQPWTRPGPWRARRLLETDAHKPEAIVSLSAGCAAVIYDDDDKYKRRQRKRAGADDAAWQSQSAFVSYVRVPPP